MSTTSDFFNKINLNKLLQIAGNRLGEWKSGNEWVLEDESVGGGRKMRVWGEIKYKGVGSFTNIISLLSKRQFPAVIGDRLVFKFGGSLLK